MSAFLESVRIAGIMGVPNELELDLTSPLTLIYAPNGTGKTSIWTAVKALMTMGIDVEVVCRAVDARPARVVGELLINDVRHTATVTTTGALMLASETQERLSGTVALRRLAPEVDTTGIQTRGGVLKDRLISQIQACRFLPSDSLLYLIDNGEESTELRRKIFADLTGTSVIQAEVRETKRYRDRLSEERIIVGRSLQTIEEQMQAFGVTHNLASSDSLRLIAQAASVAGIQLRPEASAQEALSLLREIQTSRYASLEISRAAYTTWRSTESAYPELDRDLAEVSRTLNDAKGAREGAQQALSRTRSELDPGRAKRARQQHETVQHGLTRLAALVAAEGRTRLLTGSSLASLRQLLRLFDSEHAIQSRLGALQQLDGSRHKYRDQVSERKALLEKSKKLAANLHIPSSTLQARLNEKSVERSALAARINRHSDLAASLRASAQSLVVNSQSSTCPCCSHRWQSTDALLGAIAEGDRSGRTDPRLGEELEAAERAIGELQIQIAAASVTEEQLRALQKRLGELKASIERTERLSIDNNVPPARLLEAAETLEEVYTLRSHLDLWRILEAVKDLGGDIDETQTIDVTLSALSIRGEALRSAAAREEQAEAERNLLMDRQQGELHLSSQLVSRCEEQLAKLTRVRQERDVAIERLRSTGIFAGPQTGAALDEGMSSVERLGILITQVAAAVEVSAAIAAREQIAANQRVLQVKQGRIVREVEHSDRLIDILTQAEKQAGQQFFERLGPAVGTLFDHMQVNRVFRSLEISAIKESFRLDGQLDDGVSLDPGSHFSQGQRQDLALSMFLVRAASLGGSFFLDEPLVHLDDLNRTALLDCLRACALGTASSARPVRLVVTTANWSVARHLMQKFYNLRHPGAQPWLRVIQLSGNVRSGLSQSVVFPADDKGAEIPVH